MSSLYLRGKSIWIGFTDLRGGRLDRPTGIRLKEIKYDKNGKVIFPPEALRFQKDIDSNIHLNIWKFAGEPKLRVTIDQTYEEFLRTHGSRRKPSTQRIDKLAMDRLKLVFGDCYLGEITEDLLFKWRGALLAKKISEQSLAQSIRHLSTLFSWAERKGYVEKSPFTRDIKLNPPKPPKAVFKDNEIQQLFRILKQRNPAAAIQMRFLYLTGFRATESCNLKWDQIDFGDRLIKHWE